MALTANQLRFIQVDVTGVAFNTQAFVPNSGEFIKFNGSLHPTSSVITQSDVSGLVSALSGKQAASSHLDNYVAAGAGIVKKDGSGNVTSLASTAYGEGLLTTVDAAGARSYLGISGLVGAVVYQSTLNSQVAINALPAASSANKGYYYVITGAGATESFVLGATPIGNGDWIISNGTTYEKVDGQINTDQITTSNIVNDAVTTAKILDANITTAKIADANVTTAKIADANVTTAKILDANVTTAKIADANVTTAKLADDSVTTAKILDANVTTAKILDANVTTAKIATDAVTTIKILDANVTTAKIATDAVTTVKILDANVTTAKIADANVTTAKILDANVTRAKLSSTAIFNGVVPVSSSSTGVANDLIYDTDYLYIAVGTNDWRRIDLITF